MKKLLLLITIATLLSSCRGRQGFNREFQNRTYDITVYSGGKVVYHDIFTGRLNQEDHSDGIYYFKGDTLVEVGGQYTIKSVK